MSLTAFHLLFVALSVVLSAFVAAWAFSQYQAVGAAGYLVGAIGSLAAGGGMMAYGLTIRRKLQRL